MILKKYKNNLRPLFTILALITTMLWWGANTTNAQTPANRGTLHDFTGSGRTSFVTLRGLNGSIRWSVAANPQDPRPNQALIREFDFGTAVSGSIDEIVPENYTGDTKTEPTVWRPGNGTFYVAQTPLGTGGITLERAVQWGAPGDIPSGIGDYDGDGRTDYTVVRPVGDNFIWYIMSSSTGTMRAIPFGSQANTFDFKIFPGADFTGDGRDELIFVTTPADQSSNTYFIGDAVTGAGVITRNFGAFISDVAIPPDDYTGDGKADFVSVRQTDGSPAIWFILDVDKNTFTSTRFGIADRTFTTFDQPIRGDFDGDKRHDIAVFRETNQTFYWINSSNGSIGSQLSPASSRGIALGSLEFF